MVSCWTDGIPTIGADQHPATADCDAFLSEEVLLSLVGGDEFHDLAPGIDTTRIAEEGIGRACIIAASRIDIVMSRTHDDEISADTHAKTGMISRRGFGWNKLGALAPCAGTAEIPLENVGCTRFAGGAALSVGSDNQQITIDGRRDPESSPVGCIGRRQLGDLAPQTGASLIAI